MPRAADPVAPKGHSRASRRDRTTLRRAAASGGVAWALVGLPLVAVQIAAEAGARGAIGGVLIGLVFGSMVAAGWLLLAATLDVVAGHRLSRRRIVWTVAIAALAALSPLFVIMAPA